MFVFLIFLFLFFSFRLWIAILSLNCLYSLVSCSTSLRSLFWILFQEFCKFSFILDLLLENWRTLGCCFLAFFCFLCPCFDIWACGETAVFSCWAGGQFLVARNCVILVELKTTYSTLWSSSLLFELGIPPEFFFFFFKSSATKEKLLCYKVQVLYYKIYSQWFVGQEILGYWKERGWGRLAVGEYSN